jgi:UDP-3-O-acyl-N-acetylglucosamine deacetylase
MERRTRVAHALGKPVSLEGVGLFTGAPAAISIGPGTPGKGIVFRRVDLPGSPEIPALVRHVIPAGVGPLAKIPGRNTSLAAPGGAFVLTVEHVLSALVGLDVWDAVIDVRGPEIPMFDGSALEFVRAIRGVVQPAADAPAPVAISGSKSWDDGKGASFILGPAEKGCRYEYTLDYSGAGPAASAPGSGLARTSVAWELGDAAAYEALVAPARTFCLAAEAVAMRAAGLFGHVTPAQMLVIGDDGQPIDNALRFPDEPARHKLLDLIGDLALVGAPIRGVISTVRTGHATNHEVARRIVP